MKIIYTLTLSMTLLACGESDFAGQSDASADKEESTNESTEAAPPEEVELPEESVGDPMDPSCIPDDLTPLQGWKLSLEEDVLIVDGSDAGDTLKAVGNGNPGEIDFSSGTEDTLTIKCGKRLVINGNGGADSLEIGGISGLLSIDINGDAGNDTISLIGEGDQADIPITLNGGAGDDTMNVGPGPYASISANGD